MKFINTIAELYAHVNVMPEYEYEIIDQHPSCSIGSIPTRSFPTGATPPVGFVRVPPVVLNAKRIGSTASTSSRVFIARPSKWGNPFVIGRDGDRMDVIEKYGFWLMTQPRLLASLRELQGKDLLCWCDPEPCHGHILIELANDEEFICKYS